MNSVTTYIKSRLSEPSTWIGIGNVMASITQKDWGAAIQAAAGILGIVIPEKGSKK